MNSAIERLSNRHQQLRTKG